MKGYAALIDPSKFDGSEAELTCYSRDRRTSMRMMAGHEDDLFLLRLERVCSELCCSEMIKGLHDLCSGEGFGYDNR